MLYYDYLPDFVWLGDLNPETYHILDRAAKVCIYGELAEDMAQILRKKCTRNGSPEILTERQTIQLFNTTEQPILAIVGYEGLLRFNKLLATENYTKAFWEE